MASSDPKRGEVWLTSFGNARPGEPGKNRPALVVSADELLTGLDTELVVVVPVSASRAGSVLRPEIPVSAGVDRGSVAVPRGIRGLARSRLLERLGRVDGDAMMAVEEALAAILDVGNAPR